MTGARACDLLTARHQRVREGRGTGPRDQLSETPRMRQSGTAARARSGQCEQLRAWPASSDVRKLEPQPQPETAFGLFTVKPAPISVST